MAVDSVARSMAMTAMSSGGTEYTAGNGIVISNNVISEQCPIVKQTVAAHWLTMNMEGYGHSYWKSQDKSSTEIAAFVEEQNRIGTSTQVKITYNGTEYDALFTSVSILSYFESSMYIPNVLTNCRICNTSDGYGFAADLGNITQIKYYIPAYNSYTTKLEGAAVSTASSLIINNSNELSLPNNVNLINVKSYNDSIYAIGDSNTASSNLKYGLMIGTSNLMKANNSCAIGTANRMSGLSSLAVGNYNNIAGGLLSFAVGYGNDISGDTAISVANTGYSRGNHTFLANLGTKAMSSDQSCFGKYNVADSSSTYAFIIGNGTGDSARSNALTVDWSGNLVCNNIPAAPSTAGTYKLQCVIDSEGAATYSWVADT